MEGSTAVPHGLPRKRLEPRTGSRAVVPAAFNYVDSRAGRGNSTPLPNGTNTSGRSQPAGGSKSTAAHTAGSGQRRARRYKRRLRCAPGRCCLRSESGLPPRRVPSISPTALRHRRLATSRTGVRSRHRSCLMAVDVRRKRCARRVSGRVCVPGGADQGKGVIRVVIRHPRPTAEVIAQHTPPHTRPRGAIEHVGGSDPTHRWESSHAAVGVVECVVIRTVRT